MPLEQLDSKVLPVTQAVLKYPCPVTQASEQLLQLSWQSLILEKQQDPLRFIGDLELPLKSKRCLCQCTQCAFPHASVCLHMLNHTNSLPVTVLVS